MIKIFIVLFIMGIFVFIFTWIGELNAPKKAKKIGDAYESLVAKKIKAHLGIVPVRNVIISTDDDQTEVDMVLVNTKGVFAIECKHRGDSDILTGSYDDQVYTILPDEPIKNPFRQNYKHQLFLQDLLSIDSTYNIVFVNCSFNLKYNGEEHRSYQNAILNLLARERCAMVSEDGNEKGIIAFADAINSLPDIYTAEEVDNMINILSAHIATDEEREAHAEYIKNKYS